MGSIESKHPSLPPGFLDGETGSIYSLNIFIGKLFVRDYFRHTGYISEQNRQKFLKLWRHLLGRQTDIGNMLESAMGGNVEQDKGDQCWEVGGGGVLLSGRGQGGSP